ncbi:hypothetical protein BDY24DRAFT_385329 [Mrakia frigida]|uniref:uncharacterized protein n=1 Tax=Mrakia frigida TaxID=29902 RepID=UPI003FCC12A6
MRTEEPPSLAPLLRPLTFVSKGFRDLVFPLLYKNVTIRREEDWTLLLDPIKGILVGKEEEATRKRRSIQTLSFVPNSFPSSWIPSKLRSAGSEPEPELVMAPLDFSCLRGLGGVWIGSWRDMKGRVEEKNQALFDEEDEGGPQRPVVKSEPRSTVKIDPKEETVDKLLQREPMEERKPTMSVKKEESVDVGLGVPSRAERRRRM